MRLSTSGCAMFTAVALGGCGIPAVSEAGNKVAAADARSLCIDRTVQAALRDVITTTARSNFSSQAQAGAFQGSLGLVRIVIGKLNAVEFSDTALTSSNDAVTVCEASVGFADGGKEAKPRISYTVKRTIEGGDLIVSLNDPREVQSLITRLAEMLPVEKAEPLSEQAKQPDECFEADGTPKASVENPCTADAVDARAAALTEEAEGAANEMGEDE